MADEQLELLQNPNLPMTLPEASHRELIAMMWPDASLLNNKNCMAFLKLPHAVQDYIIESLDNETLTQEQASEYTKEQGCYISAVSINKYYVRLKRVRMFVERANMMGGLQACLSQYDLGSMLKSVMAAILPLIADTLTNPDHPLKLKPKEIAQFLTLFKDIRAQEIALEISKNNQTAKPVGELSKPVQTAVQDLYGISS